MSDADSQEFELISIPHSLMYWWYRIEPVYLDMNV